MSTNASALPSLQVGASALRSLAERFRDTATALEKKAMRRNALTTDQAARIIQRNRVALATEDGVIRSSVRAIRATTAALASLDFAYLGNAAKRRLAAEGGALPDSVDMKLPFRIPATRPKAVSSRPDDIRPAEGSHDVNNAPLPSAQPARSARH